MTSKNASCWKGVEERNPKSLYNEYLFSIYYALGIILKHVIDNNSFTHPNRHVNRDCDYPQYSKETAETESVVRFITYSSQLLITKY